MNISSRTLSAIKSLTVKASKGNYKATKQLYEHYTSGKYVPKDNAKADFYLDLLKEVISEQKLALSRLNLENYRAFKNIEISRIDRGLIVFVGNNGAGKTTILDAIADSISVLRSGIVSNSLSTKDIVDTGDITIGSDSSYTSIQTSFYLNDKISADLELVKNHKGSLSNKKSMLTEISELSNSFKILNENDKTYNFPILAYYTVNRSLDIQKKDISIFDETSSITEPSKFDAYDNSLNGRADFKGFFRWFKRVDDIQKHRIVNSPARKERDNLINSIKASLSVENAKKVISDLPSLTEEEKSLNEDDYFDLKSIVEIINEVLECFMEGFTNLKVNVEPYLSLTIDKFGKELSVLQLSQGEKSLLALLLDITRRFILLNPSLPNPLDGHGIILIDEIDLHLHPRMQRRLIKKLPKIFKNCQFIISTHSPQIVSEVKPEQLIVLTRGEGNELDYYRPKQSFGLTSNEVLNSIMAAGMDDGKQLIRNESVYSALIEIDNLIATGEVEKLDLAFEKVEELEELLGGQIPETIKAKLEIDLCGWDD